MPKIKTIKAAAKRFTVSASGKIKHKQSHRSHILTKKSTKRKRQLRTMNPVHDSDRKAVARMIPYL
jgi:large subunit ribosomal protein L35